MHQHVNAGVIGDDDVGHAIAIQVADGHPVRATRIERDRIGEGSGRRLQEQRDLVVGGNDVGQAIAVHVGNCELRSTGRIEHERSVERAGCQAVVTFL